MKAKKTIISMLFANLVCFTLVSAVVNDNTETSAPARPNILFIAVDDLRPELGCYGNETVITPNFDRLASEGTVFTRSYCNVPVCGASRASLLTGSRPTDYRFLQFYSRADEDYPDATVLPQHFKDNGYHTVSLGKVFHMPGDKREAWDALWRPSPENGSPRNYLLPENVSMDDQKTPGAPYEMVDVPDSAYLDGEMALLATDYLRKFNDTKQPFFLAVGFRKPHLPFNAPKKYWDLYDPEQIDLPANPFPPQDAPKEAFHPWKELRTYHTVPKEGDLHDTLALKLKHAYYACVSYIDAQLGLLLQTLEETGLAENTIVVIWGDHGWNLGENALWGKHCNFNYSLRAPLIFKVPWIASAGKNNSITEFIDIYPTLCDFAGLEKPGHLDGESLVRRIENPQLLEEDYAICKFVNGVTIIKGQYFYSEWYDENDNTISDMLYDHTTDPEENVNLSSYPEYAGLVKQLKAEIRKKRGDKFFKK